MLLMEIKNIAHDSCRRFQQQLDNIFQLINSQWVLLSNHSYSGGTIMRFLSATLAFFFILSGAFGRENEDYLLKKKILEAKKKTELYNQKANTIKTRIESFKKTQTERIKNRKSDISRLGSDVAQLEKELKSEKLEIKRFKGVIKNYKIQFSQFKEKCISHMINYNRIIKESIPYNRKSRSQNISRLIADTEFANISSEEIFNRYYNFLNKELLTAFDSEVYVEDNLKYLRIGWIIMAYADESGNDVGILTRDNKNKWTWKNDIGFSMRKAIRDSIKMIEGKKAPELIDFPVPLSLIKEK